MENVTLFLCDIYGTYMKNNEFVSKYEIIKFLENLEKLRKINNSKKILFSFISTEKEDLLREQIHNLYINNNNENIKLGIQFFENGYFSGDKIVYNECCGKISQILEYVDKIQLNYKIDKIYYADDTEFYHFMLSNLLIDSLLKNKFQSIIPHTKYGLEDLNNRISEITKSKVYQFNKI